MASKKRKSACDAIMNLMADIYNTSENNNLSRIILCDLTKAFDCISHDILLEKLDRYGIHGPAKDLLRNYLINRQQRVDINGSYSDLKFVKHIV